MSPNDNHAPRASDALSAPRQQTPFAGMSAMRAYLRDYLAAAVQSGPDAESEYERALANLRKNPAEVVIEIATAFGECDPRDYPSRWNLIFAASELRHEAALPFLVHVADTPLPPEPKEPSHGFSIVSEETILRTTALEGVGYHAAEGNPHAIEALMRALKVPSISIRRAAVESLRRTKQYESLHERIQAELSPDFHFLMELRHPRVQEVTQVSDPKRFLSAEARTYPREAPPIFPSRRSKRGEPPGR